VHYPTDVLGGYAAGIVWITLIRVARHVWQTRARAEGVSIMLIEQYVERALAFADVYGHGLPAAAMPLWYHACDVLLHPSFDAEGFPLPPLEAMAAGVPVVLTDIPSFASLSEDVAARVPAGDASGMARETAHLLDEPWLWATRRAKGLEAARTFSIDRVLDRLTQIFSEG